MEKFINFMITFFFVGVVGGIIAIFRKIAQRREDKINSIEEQKLIDKKFKSLKEQVLKENPDIRANKEEILEEINRNRKLN